MNKTDFIFSLADLSDAPTWSTLEYVEVPTSEATTLALRWLTAVMAGKRPDLAYTHIKHAAATALVERDEALLFSLMHSGVAAGYVPARGLFAAHLDGHNATDPTLLGAIMRVICMARVGATVRVPEILQLQEYAGTKKVPFALASEMHLKFEYPKPLGNLRALGYTLGYSEARDDWTYMVPEWLHDDNVRARELGKYRWIKGDERCSGFTQAEKDAAVAEGRAKKAANQFRKDE